MTDNSIILAVEQWTKGIWETNFESVLVANKSAVMPEMQTRMDNELKKESEKFGCRFRYSKLTTESHRSIAIFISVSICAILLLKGLDKVMFIAMLYTGHLMKSLDLIQKTILWKAVQRLFVYNNNAHNSRQIIAPWTAPWRLHMT